MKRINFKAITDTIIDVVNRFFPVLIFVFGVAILSFLKINKKDFDPEFYVWGFFLLGTVAMLPVSVLMQQTGKWSVKLLLLLGVVAVVALYNFAFLEYKPDWGKGQFALMMVVSVLTFLYVLYVGKKQDMSFWVFTATVVRELIITGVYVSVLFGGLSLAIYAIDILFGVNVSDKFYANLSVCCYLFVAPFYFLSNVPSKAHFYADKIEYHKFLKILGLYVMLPVLAVYVVILYIYLLKIIVSWQLPDGWVTTLVSVLALGGYVAKFILYPASENGVVKFLNKYFSLLLFPLIVLMSIGLARRFADYGITINRLYVLVFNVWLYGVSIYLFLTQSRHLRWLVVSFTVVLFLVSVGPWSVFSVTHRVIQKDLTELLSQNKLLVNGKLQHNPENKLNIPDTVSMQIYDKINYLVGYYGIEKWKEAFITADTLKTRYDIVSYLGVDSYSQKGKYSYLSLPDNLHIELDGYSELYYDLNYDEESATIYKNDNINISCNNQVLVVENLKLKKSTSVDLNQICISLFEKSGSEELKSKLMIHKQDNVMLVISSLNLEKEKNDKIKITSMHLSVFVK